MWERAHVSLCYKPLFTQSFHQRLFGYFSNFKLPLTLTKLRTYKEKLFYSENQLGVDIC